MAGFGMDLVQIPNFAIDGPDPGLAAMEGFYGARENARRDQLAQISGNVDMRAQQQADQERIRFGQEQAALQQQQQAQAQMAARAREAESALAALADKISEGTARAGDFAALQTQFPEMSEGLKEPIAALEEERRKSYTSLLYRSAIALKSNKPEVAAQLFKDRAEAARNSGDAIDADLSEATAEMIMESKDDPAEMLAMLGILGQSFDPKMNVAIFGEGEGNLSDRFKVVGSQLVDLNAEGGPQAVLTAPGQTETIYGPDGQPILTRGDSEVGTIPQGYELITDPETGARSMRPIPGGPEDMSSKTSERADSAVLNASIVKESIAQAKTLAVNKGGVFPSTGYAGQKLREVGGTAANDLRAAIDSITGNIAFDRLQKMREESPTGGALGAVSDTEMRLLASTIASLDQSQSREQFLTNLARVEEVYDGIIKKFTAYPSAGGSGSPGQTVIIDGYTIEEVP